MVRYAISREIESNGRAQSYGTASGLDSAEPETTGRARAMASARGDERCRTGRG
jgi:hypothetical protein